MRVRIFQPQCCVSVTVLRMGCAEVVFIQPGGKLDTMWRGAWQRLATRLQGRCGCYKWSLQQNGAPSHTCRNTETCSVRTFSSLSQIFCPPNSPDLNTVNLPSGVLFSRRSTMVDDDDASSKFLLSWQNEESDCQKHGRNYCLAQSFSIHHFYHFFIYG